MFKSFLKSNLLAKNRIIKEQFYEQVAGEIAKGYIREGLWAQAFSKSKGSNDVAKSIYIKLRVQSLIDKIKLEEEARRGIIISQAVRTPVPHGNSTSTSSSGKKDKVKSEYTENPIKKKDIEVDIETFDLKKIKSAVMRDQVDYLKRVISDLEINDFMMHIQELINLSDLFDSHNSKKYLSELKRGKKN